MKHNPRFRDTRRAGHPTCHALLCGAALLAAAKRLAEEFYDLAKDPDQTKNLAGDPAYAVKKGELAARLLKVLRDAGDPRVFGDGRTFDRPPYAGPLPQAPKKKSRAAQCNRGC